MAKKRQSIHRILGEYIQLSAVGDGDIVIKIYKDGEIFERYYFDEETALKLREDIKKEISKSKEVINNG